MLEISQSTNTPVSRAGLLNSKWKKFVFFFHKRVFLSKLEDILSAAAGHEGNSLPSGNCQYQVLNAHGDELCTEFAERWGLDRDLLIARVPGIAKLSALSVPPPTKSYARLACLGAIAIPLALFLLGIMAG